jgi:hypothetical protein
MKQLLFFIIFATLFISCDKSPSGLTEKQPDLTKIKIAERPCETLEYIGKTGNDFNSSLDSLRNLKSISSEIIKESLEVLFDYDNRHFFGIKYGDCGIYTDVLDTKGNYYLRTYYCPNENDLQEEAIFNENKIFSIIHGACGSIMYQSRIGNNFDSALDSLIKRREPAIFANTWVEEYYTEKKIMTIDFNYDGRAFYSIGFMDKSQGFHIFSLTDVIDSEGNYFAILWCED